MSASNKTKPAARVLLVEANNMGKWVGTTMPYEVHIPPWASCISRLTPATALPGDRVPHRRVLACPVLTMNASSAS
jgi:hypothetical protein